MELRNAREMVEIISNFVEVAVLVVPGKVREGCRTPQVSKLDKQLDHGAAKRAVPAETGTALDCKQQTACENSGNLW